MALEGRRAEHIGQAGRQFVVRRDRPLALALAVAPLEFAELGLGRGRARGPR